MSEAGTIIYHIYGRKAYAEPLAFVQTVTLHPDEPIPVPQGDDWIEVVAFPQTAIIEVIPQEKERVA